MGRARPKPSRRNGQGTGCVQAFVVANHQSPDERLASRLALLAVVDVRVQKDQFPRRRA